MPCQCIVNEWNDFQLHCLGINSSLAVQSLAVSLFWYWRSLTLSFFSYWRLGRCFHINKIHLHNIKKVYWHLFQIYEDCLDNTMRICSFVNWDNIGGWWSLWDLVFIIASINSLWVLLLFLLHDCNPVNFIMEKNIPDPCWEGDSSRKRKQSSFVETSPSVRVVYQNLSR